MLIAYRVLPGHKFLPPGYIAVVRPDDPDCAVALYHPNQARGLRDVMGDRAHLQEITRDAEFTELHGREAAG